jgi:hypothetical protein
MISKLPRYLALLVFLCFASTAQADTFDHMITNNQCADWNSIIRFEQQSVSGTCQSCHNNSVTEGKPLQPAILAILPKLGYPPLSTTPTSVAIAPAVITATYPRVKTRSIY